MLLPIVNTSPSSGKEAGSAAPTRAGTGARVAESSAQPVAQQPGVSASGAVDRAQLEEAVQQAQEAVLKRASNLRFVLDDETGKTIVKVVDSQTNEVIRQIPSEEMLAISRNLARIEGLLFKNKA